MSEELRARVVEDTPPSRLGTPQDTAHLVRFLCSGEGTRVDGQLLESNGGWDS